MGVLYRHDPYDKINSKRYVEEKPIEYSPVQSPKFKPSSLITGKRYIQEDSPIYSSNFNPTILPYWGSGFDLPLQRYWFLYRRDASFYPYPAVPLPEPSFAIDKVRLAKIFLGQLPHDITISQCLYAITVATEGKVMIYRIELIMKSKRNVLAPTGCAHVYCHPSQQNMLLEINNRVLFDNNGIWMGHTERGRREVKILEDHLFFNPIYIGKEMPRATMKVELAHSESMKWVCNGLRVPVNIQPPYTVLYPFLWQKEDYGKWVSEFDKLLKAENITQEQAKASNFHELVKLVGENWLACGPINQYNTSKKDLGAVMYHLSELILCIVSIKYGEEAKRETKLKYEKQYNDGNIDLELLLHL